MKLAVFSESPIDDSIFAILVAAVYGSSIDVVDNYRTRAGGWPSVFRELPSVLTKLHFASLAEALVVIVDSNSSPIHTTAHTTPSVEPNCRLCQLRRVATEKLVHLGDRPHGARIQTAFGLAVPALEAWLLCCTDPHMSEALLRTKTSPHDKIKLKEQLSGAPWPAPPGLLAERSMVEATRLAASDLACLETMFPDGFGSMAKDIRSW